MGFGKTLLVAGITAGVIYGFRHIASKGQAQWIADHLALNSDKPTINIGARYSKWGDVCCDINPIGTCVYADAEDLSQWADKTFSVALLSHVLEHVEHPEVALSEAQRIADNVVVDLPSPLDVAALLNPTHKWVFWGNNKVALNPALTFSILTTVGLSGIILALGKR
jgi:hypothetical protein